MTASFAGQAHQTHSTGNRARKPRQSGIDDMYAIGSISHAVKDAADRFADFWAAQHSDGLKAIDYIRQKVDGRRFGSAMPSASYARDELQRVRHALGQRHFTALKVAAGEGGDVNDVRVALVVKSKTTASKVLKEALSALAEFWKPIH